MDAMITGEGPPPAVKPTLELVRTGIPLTVRKFEAITQLTVWHGIGDVPIANGHPATMKTSDKRRGRYPSIRYAVDIAGTMLTMPP